MIDRYSSTAAELLAEGIEITWKACLGTDVLFQVECLITATSSSAIHKTAIADPKRAKLSNVDEIEDEDHVSEVEDAEQIRAVIIPFQERITELTAQININPTDMDYIKLNIRREHLARQNTLYALDQSFWSKIMRGTPSVNALLGYMDLEIIQSVQTVDVIRHDMFITIILGSKDLNLGNVDSFLDWFTSMLPFSNDVVGRAFMQMFFNPFEDLAGEIGQVYLCPEIRHAKRGFDIQMIENITKVKVIDNDLTISIIFEFKINSYFTNNCLIKTYHLDDTDNQVLGTKINWVSNPKYWKIKWAASQAFLSGFTRQYLTMQIILVNPLWRCTHILSPTFRPMRKIGWVMSHTDQFELGFCPTKLALCSFQGLL
ncbi:hypothetical protein EJB05_43047, partial [Eragrostis curvula]